MASNSSKVTTLNKREFKSKIFDYTYTREWEYKGDMPAVIDFYADWCKPCKFVSPLLEQVSKVFGISSIPTLLFIGMEGKPVVVRGAQPIGALRKNVDKILPGEKKSFLKNLFTFNR